jgi:hypothetical protein
MGAVTMAEAMTCAVPPGASRFQTAVLPRAISLRPGLYALEPCSSIPGGRKLLPPSYNKLNHNCLPCNQGRHFFLVTAP